MAMEVTDEVKKLAARCATDGQTAGEIQDVSDEIRAQVGDYLRSLSDQTRSAQPDAPEIEEEDPRLKRFADFYKRFTAEDKERCPWQRVWELLLANNGHYLALANAMNEGGILFGVDNEGNPLIADGGEEPIMTDMNYGDTRNAVYLKDPQREWVPDNMTGYEMFPYAGDHNKSPEILAFETFTGKPFVSSPDKQEWRSSWLESGKDTAWPRDVAFHPNYGRARVYYGDPEHLYPLRGVRRLLRVKVS